MGIFKVTTGVMGSSKSTRAIAEVKNLRRSGLNVLVIKPEMDSRDGMYISSRLINEKIKADIIISNESTIDESIIDGYDYIIVDEIHMVSVDKINELYVLSAKTNINISLYGLAISWKGLPFISTAYAMAYADKIEKIETFDISNRLISHHIKRDSNGLCNINSNDSSIEVGDIDNSIYSTSSKQEFYTLY